MLILSLTLFVLGQEGLVSMLYLELLTTGFDSE